jgi:hypothetical protein
MKNKISLLGMLVLVLVLTFGLVFFGCGSGAPGTLIVNNCPSSPFILGVVISDSNEPTTKRELLMAIMNYGIAEGVVEGGKAGKEESGATSYKLKERANGAVFNNSGDYLVVLSIGLTSYFKKVSFYNGSGSVDFNSMTNGGSLPY